MEIDIEDLKKQIEGMSLAVEYDDILHTYTLDGEELMPVTTKTSTYAEPFQKWAIAKALAKKFSSQSSTEVKATDVIKSWELKRLASAEKGTKIHSFIEAYPNLIREPDCVEEQGAINWYKELPDHYIPIAQEKIVYSKAKKMAGRFDRLFLNTLTQSLVIVDWKTNDDILKNYKGKKLKEPFEDYLDCPLHKNYIQQNIYKQLLDDMLPVKVGEMLLVHLHADYPGFFKIFQVPDLTSRL